MSEQQEELRENKNLALAMGLIVKCRVSQCISDVILAVLYQLCCISCVVLVVL